MSASTTSTGRMAHTLTAPANPNASPPQIRRRPPASRSPSNTASAPSRQNSTSHGSSSTVLAACMLSGYTAMIPQLTVTASSPR